jgi:VanZ family protein
LNDDVPVCQKRAHRANEINFKLRPPRGPFLLFAVSKLRSFAKYWLPIILWFGLIFLASSDVQSAARSSRIIGPLVHWLFPKLSDQAVGNVVLIVRKCAHLTEFAILASLFWRAFRKPVKADTRPWSWREAGAALLGVALYATTDEVHQAFVPGRFGKFHDVLIDSAGGALGLLALWAFGRWRKRW